AANSAKTKFGANVDTRSYHGYVLGHGSTIDGVMYRWAVREDKKDALREPASINDIALCPCEVITAAGEPVERKTLPVDIVWDEPASISAATAFLRHAPGAAVGSRGSTAYKLAARCRQYGASADTTLDLMATIWNVEGRVDPPMPLDELNESIDHAYAYATAAPHTPGAEFEGYALPLTEGAEQLAPTQYSAPDWPSPTELPELDFDDLPERQWVIPSLLAKGFLTGLIAPSGAGKTQFLIQMIVAIAANRPDIVNAQHLAPGKVWLWNQEDDIPELKRRLAAALHHFQIEQSAIAGNVFVDSGVDKPLLLVARDAQGHLRKTKRVATIIKHMLHNQIQCLAIDPFVEFHEADENNNVEIRIVAATLREIAVATNAAVIIGHHTKKPDNAKSDGFAGNADSGRGASSLQGVTRIMATLYAMSEADAKRLKIKAEDRWRYIRLDGAKSNISASPSGTRPEWFERKGHKLRPDGEEIGILSPTNLTASRVLREAEAQGLDATEEEVARDGHPWAAALADVMEENGVAHGHWAGVARYRDLAASRVGERTGHSNKFGKWCADHVIAGDHIPAGNGRTLHMRAAKNPGSGPRMQVVGSPDSPENYLE
ncbi:MAG: AAA family ATPase, partial [Aestuariivirga sp.]